MKAVLTYTNIKNGEKTEETRLFDTEKSTKICDVKNGYGVIMHEIHISKAGILFTYDKKRNKIQVTDQKKCKEWLGEHEPDKYIEFLGRPEEA